MQMIYAPGFSTASQVTELAGRGVGGKRPNLRTAGGGLSLGFLLCVQWLERVSDRAIFIVRRAAGCKVGLSDDRRAEQGGKLSAPRF